MPGFVLMAQLCPKGMEASMYALLAGCYHLGGSVAQCFGAFLLSELAVVPAGKEGEGDTFRNLWIAALISPLVPAVSMFMIPYCVPDALQTEVVLGSHPSSATAGSPWERIIGKRHENVDVMEGGTKSAPAGAEDALEPLIKKYQGQKLDAQSASSRDLSQKKKEKESPVESVTPNGFKNVYRKARENEHPSEQKGYLSPSKRPPTPTPTSTDR